MIKEYPESDEKRIIRGYELAYGRQPDESELNDMLEFHKSMSDTMTRVEPEESKREHQVWKSISRVLLASSEFLYVN